MTGAAWSEADRAGAALLIAFLLLLAIPVLFLFRGYDDNALTSFRWVFSHTRLEWVFVYAAAGIGAAYLLSASAMPERVPSLTLFAVSFTAAVSLFGTPEAIIDAARYFLEAKYLSIHGAVDFLRAWGGDLKVWTDMPVVPFAYGLIFSGLGETRLYVQLANALALSMTVVMINLAGRELWDRRTGFFAGLFLIGMPYLLTQAPLMLVDVPTMFLFTFTVFSFIKLNKNGGPLWIAVSTSMIVLTLFAKYSTWPMLCALPVITFVFYRGGSGTAPRNSAAAVIIAGAISLFIFSWKADVFREQIGLLLTYQREGLTWWSESFTSTFLFQTSPFITAFALIGAAVAAWRRDVKFLVPGFFALFTLALSVGRIRYLVPLFPLFALMASYGLVAVVHDNRTRKFIGYGVVALSFVSVFGGFYPFLKGTSMANLQKAGEYLDRMHCESVGVHTLAQKDSLGNTAVAIPLMDIYTDVEIVSLQEPPRAHDTLAIQKSSLRFTWEMGQEKFYSASGPVNSRLIAVISSVPLDETPEALPAAIGGATRIQEFTESSGVFRYKTFVTLLGEDCAADRKGVVDNR